MEAEASHEIPLPYVFFTKSNIPHDPLDRVPGQHKADSFGGGGGGSAGGGGGHSAAAGAAGGAVAVGTEDHLTATGRPASGGSGGGGGVVGAGGAVQDDLEQLTAGGAAAASGASATAGAATAAGSSGSAGQTASAAAAAAAAAAGSASSKGERPPIMTPDERAWNDRLIKSFQTQRSLIDAIVLSPSGVVIGTLGRRIEGRVKDMDPGTWIGCVSLLLMLLNLILLVWEIFNGFIYFRIIKPLHVNFTRDYVEAYNEENITNLDYSVTTTMSLFIIQSQITFYADKADQGFVVSLFNNSNLQRSWESLTNNIVYIMMELLLGRQTLHYGYSGRDNRTSRFYLHEDPRLDAAVVPHCFQDFNALRDVWANLYYSCIAYAVAAIAQLYIAVAEVLFKRIYDFADQRDRRLSPEQMRARITIGLEGVAALQRVCFFSKLVLAMQALVTLLFHRLMLVVKNVEYNTRHMANRLEKAGLPSTDVDLCSNLVFFGMACGTVQCLGFFCFHALAKYYSNIAVTKVPQVKLVPSQDESYVT